ncbi:Cytosine-purine permease [Mycena sanguinolenta]|uniref:Cytosine-purine permease n=1 Tax=Mycena sanguinolenta TaxID=230812 RepID=A0A8H7CY30_9AGAR|nr:Cytosine-purine permease [Mycena sanguinolenta]
MQSYSPAFSWLHPESVLDSLHSLQPLNGSMYQHTIRARAQAIETRGIWRVPDQGNDKPNENFWIGLTSSLPKESRTRVPAFFLSLGDNMLTIFTNVMMTALRGYIATSHPNSAYARQACYSWRWHGARIVAHCVCYVERINTIASRQTLRAVADDRISSAAGVVIVAIITLVLRMLDFKYVHIYEKWSWIRTAITSFVLLECAARTRSGQAEASNVERHFQLHHPLLRLGLLYNLFQPASTPARTTFWWTDACAELVIPLVLDDNGVATGAHKTRTSSARCGPTKSGRVRDVLHAAAVAVVSVANNDITNVSWASPSPSSTSDSPRSRVSSSQRTFYNVVAGVYSFSTSLEDSMNVLTRAESLPDGRCERGVRFSKVPPPASFIRFQKSRRR